jgi:hypothetical protein
MISRVPFPNSRSGVIGPAIAGNPENDGHLSPWQESVAHEIILDTYKNGYADEATTGPTLGLFVMLFQTSCSADRMPGTVHQHWNVSTTEPLVFLEYILVDKDQRSPVSPWAPRRRSMIYPNAFILRVCIENARTPRDSGRTAGCGSRKNQFPKVGAGWVVAVRRRVIKVTGAHSTIKIVPRMTKLRPAPQWSAITPITGGMPIAANRFMV